MSLRTTRRLRCLVLVLLATVSCVPCARAEPPRPVAATEAVRERFDGVMAMLRSPSFRALDAAGRRDAIRRAGQGLFNWTEIARRALGAEWRTLAASDRRTFTGALALLAERAYLGPLEALAAHRIPRDPVRYLGETVDGPATTVRTVLLYPRELPIDFVMYRPARHWEAWDVRVDGVSAAANYGAQFARILAQSSFGTLVDRISTKLGEPAEPPEPAAAPR